MKNIKFEESTVLNEFAKIAIEKKLVKTAEMPSIEPKEYQMAENRVLSKFPAINSVVSGKKAVPKSVVAELERGNFFEIFRKELPKQEYLDRAKPVVDKLNLFFKQFRFKKEDQERIKNALAASGIAMSAEDGAMKTAEVSIVEPSIAKTELEKLNNEVALRRGRGEKDEQIKPFVDKFVSDFKTKYKNSDPNQLAKFETEAKKLLGTFTAAPSSPDLDELMPSLTGKKASSDKNYDVSGETGEKLVDSAHPEGSPKVDVKNTNEVIETITDQQKKDLEVINKNPTGKYSALRNIIENHLDFNTDGVKDLIALADALDNLGLYKDANEVDKILNKVKIAADDGSKYLTHIINELNKLGDAGSKGLASDLSNYTTGNISLEDAVKLVDDSVSKYADLLKFYKNDQKISGIVDIAKNKFGFKSEKGFDFKGESPVGNITIDREKKKLTREQIKEFKQKYYELMTRMYGTDTMKQERIFELYNPGKPWGVKFFNETFNEIGGLDGLNEKLKSTPPQQPPKAPPMPYKPLSDNEIKKIFESGAWQELNSRFKIPAVYVQSVKLKLQELVNQAFTEAKKSPTWNGSDTRTKHRLVDKIFEPLMKATFTPEMIKAIAPAV